MLLVTSLLSGAAVARAARFPTESLSLAHHGAGAFGVQPIPVPAHIPLDAARASGALNFPDFPDFAEGWPGSSSAPLSSLEFSGVKFEGVEPIRLLAADRQRIEARGGAPIDSWRVDLRREPKALKRLHLRTDKDRFAARNELLALTEMEKEGVFLPLKQVLIERQQEEDVGMSFLTDDYAGTLRDLMLQYNRRLDAITALDFFIDISDDLARLRRKRIPHDSPAADDILIAGDLRDLSSCRVFLCSSLSNTNLRLHSFRAVLRSVRKYDEPSDLYKEGMRPMDEAKKADMESLATLFDDFTSAVEDSQRRELLFMVQELEGRESAPSNVVRRAKRLRREWLRAYPLELGETRSTKRQWNPLNRLWKPISKKVNNLLEVYQAARANDVTVVFGDDDENLPVYVHDDDGDDGDDFDDADQYFYQYYNDDDVLYDDDIIISDDEDLDDEDSDIR